MKIPLPENQYVRKIDVGDQEISIDFADQKKVALLFISLNPHYWPYLSQVIKDARKNFLTSHNIEYFVWTDYGEEKKKVYRDSINNLYSDLVKATPEAQQIKGNDLIAFFTNEVKLYGIFYADAVKKELDFLQSKGIGIRQKDGQFYLELARTTLTLQELYFFVEALERIIDHFYADMDETLKGVTLTETEGIEWPAPTLMRYHLFLQQEDKLKDFDHIFYLDADMRIVATIGDEVFSNGLTAAEHPMYSLRKEYIPPYEPNPASTAYIQRVGRVIDDNGKPRFKPYYYAGGFQGGVASEFIEAMQIMKKNIDKDFDNNYTAIWNDESHWNKYLSTYEKDLVVLNPSYINPDSLIKEYYERLWGRSYEPKIITLTKPFSLSSKAAEEINDFIQGK